MKIYGYAIVAIVILILVILAIYYIKKLNKNKGEKSEISDVKDEVRALSRAGVKNTLQPSQISAMANSISTAMSRAGYTKSSAFQEVYRNFLRLGNELDMLSLKKEYGIREINNGLGNPIESPKLTLTGTINLLDPKEIALINMALAKKRIKPI